jgi:hypothetical protein
MDHTGSRRTRILLALVLLMGLFPGLATAQTQPPPAASPAPGANKTGGQQPAPDSSAPPANPSDETQLTFIALQTSFLTPPANPDASCASYVPDYKKYHSIMEIVEPDLRGVTNDKGSMPAGLPIYQANVAGTDTVTGESRRYGFGTGAFDPMKNRMVLRSRVGEPGTRLTFHGDAEHPFSPVPGISVWDGSIDIDPKCGLMIHAKSAEETAPAATSASTKSDSASPTLRAQRLLKALGYDSGPADGKSGARTVEAIKAFQSSEKLPVDGRVSAALLKALEARQSKSSEKLPRQ